jgi:hypothetical protein
MIVAPVSGGSFLLLDGRHQAGRFARLDAVAIAFDNGGLDHPHDLCARDLVQLRKHRSEELLKLVNVSHGFD